MRNYLRRALSGLVYVVLFITSIFFSKETYVLFVALMGCIAFWELSNLIKSKNFAIYPLFFLSVYLILKEPWFNYNWVFLGFTLIRSVRFLVSLFQDKKFSANTAIQKLDIELRYLVFPFYFLMLLPFALNGIYNPNFIICCIVILWINDTFAFLIGKNFGKRKLLETVSPKKTIEGFLGGLFFSLVAGFWMPYFITDIPFYHWLAISFIISTLGTLGDLVESKFKRQANVKDSGVIMPGHGGILDRLDSLFFMAPFLFFYIEYIL